MVNVFSVPVFFIVFRECIETVIIVSVLLSFLKQTVGRENDPKTYKKLRRQVWLGVLGGGIIVLCLGSAFIAVFYTIGADYFGQSEDIWEGTFALIASIIISIMCAALLRVSKLQDKWQVKIAKALESKEKKIRKGSFKIWCERYAMAILPFITVLREGLEAVVFVGGVGLSTPATAFPIPVLTGLAAGILVGYLIYRGGNFAPLQIFLVISTCFLYLVAAGLFSKSIWYFQQYQYVQLTGGDAAETGSGPGSYNIQESVWHVNCCNAEVNGGGGWGIFNAILGWENSATYGSVISYNIYWLAVIVTFGAMFYYEKKGHWPFMKAKKSKADDESDSQDEKTTDSKSNMDNIHELNSSSSDEAVAAKV